MEKGNETKRKKQFEIVKELIKENYDSGDCGLYDTRNIVGDPMINIYESEYFTLDICYYYSYFEVFGTTEKEFDELYDFYNNL